jgi:hypothetical protein
MDHPANAWLSAARVRRSDSATDLPRAVSFSRLLDAAGPTEMPTWAARHPLPLFTATATPTLDN